MSEIRWAWMWGLAAAIYAACKAWTYGAALRITRLRPSGYGGQAHRASRGPQTSSVESPEIRNSKFDSRSLGYLFLWPGMDAGAFLDRSRRPAPPRAAEWLFALAKLALGVALVWIVAPGLSAPLLKGWLGMLGVIFILHFGTFHLASLAWRAAGVHAEPLMRAPILAASLGDLWGRRWNLGFHDVARDLVYAPLAPRVGPAGAALAVFLASGLVHDLVISVPAGGGYGLPTAYFLVQGAGVLLERKRGFTSRIFAIAVAAGPAFWLFHPPFVRNVFLPFMEAIGA